MNRISPYPGLRPFSEEEAIFFRGRENHVSQIIQSLESNHFVMITGASGDGKSSIVYAGLVPKAKAGFLKQNLTTGKFILSDLKNLHFKTCVNRFQRH